MAATQPDPTVAIWGETLSSSTDVLNPGNTYIQGGWPFVASPPKGPPRKYMNFIQRYAHNAVRWLMRRGVNDWSSTETYSAGDIVRDTADNAFYVWSGGSPVTGGSAPHLAPGASAWQLAVPPSTWARGAFTNEIVAHRTLKGDRRHGFDHLGFLAGQVGWFDENWDKNTMSTLAATTSAGSFGDRWTVSAVGASGGFCQRLDPTSFNPSNHVHLYPATTATSTVAIAPSVDTFYFDAFRHASLRFDNFMETTAELADLELAFGLFQGLSFPFANSPFSTLAPVGVGFVKRPGDSNWQFYVKPNAGSAVFTDSTVGGYANRTRFGVELHGASVSDNGNSNTLLTIDFTGTAQKLLSGVAAIGAGAMRPMFHAHRATSGSTANGLSIGPTRVRWNLGAATDATDQFP